MSDLLTDYDVARRRLVGRANELASILRRARAATGSDDQGGLVEADLARIRSELEHHTFTIGVFGLIKRGKSTVLNAVLGTELSPTHVTPETAVPVYVEHGEDTTATVHFVSGEHRAIDPGSVGEWVSQKHNAANRRGVTHVRWTLPSALLRNGVRLVDTPGLDDAEADDLYTRRTIQELEAADAGILLFLSPPTVGAVEMAFLREVTGAQLRKTLLVANLYPQQYDDPTARGEVVDYVRRQVRKGSGLADVRIHAICAQQAWEARSRGDEAGWEAAGGAALLEALERTVAANTGRLALERLDDALRQTTEVARASIEVQARALSGGVDEEKQRRLRAHRQRVDDSDEHGLERRLREIAGTRVQLDALINGLFVRTRASVHTAKSPGALELVLSRFSREVVVVTEDAFRQLHTLIMAIHDEHTRAFDAGVATTLHELGAVRPNGGSLGVDRPGLAEATRNIGHTGLRAAALGGVISGGATFALVGSLLGPVGVLAGAAVGWRLGTIVRTGRELKPMREEVDAQIAEIADTVLEQFDRHIDDLLAAVRAATDQRRRGFASDLTELLTVLERLGPDEEPRRHAADTLYGLTARLEELAAVGRPFDAPAISA